jgi:TolA-binding protein
MTCPRAWEVRAVEEGRLGAHDVAAFERHARTCAECRDEVAAFEELRALTEQLPVQEASELRLRRLRAVVLRDAMSPPRSGAPHRALTAMMVAAVTIGVALFFLRTRPAAREANAGFVVPGPGAAWTQTREGRVERVVLRDGDLALHVRKQAPGERFLVVVPDGEVEVRGTTFEVAVHDGHATRVHVDEGVVEVRVGATATLHAGETWQRPTVTQGRAEVHATSEGPPPVAPVITARPRDVAIDLSPVHPRQRTTLASAASAAPRTPGAVVDDAHEVSDYAHAVEAYRTGQFEAAAELLHRFAVAHPSSAFLDDASFLEATSLANAGRSDAAALLAERYLTQFPSSFHRKEAAILVARLRRDRGDCDGARKVTAEWINEVPVDARIAAALGGCAVR